MGRSSRMKDIIYEQHSSGRMIHIPSGYLIPNTHLNNPHFPSASGCKTSAGAGRCNTTAMKLDAISKKTWEDNISTEQFLKTKSRILKLITQHNK